MVPYTTFNCILLNAPVVILLSYLVNITHKLVVYTE